MPALRLIALLALSVAMTGAADAETPPHAPFKPVAIVLPPDVKDPALDVLRKELAAAAQNRDHTALARITANNFYWERESGDAANMKKSGVDNLSAALGLVSKDAAGWDILATYADDPTASPSPDHKGAMCSPAEPAFDGGAFDKLMEATRTDVADWAYPVSPGVEMQATAQKGAAVIDKLGLYLVRILPEATASSPAYLRVALPSGKAGFVSIDNIAPIGNDQICYVKDGSAWKIGGYVGGGEPQ